MSEIYVIPNTQPIILIWAMMDDKNKIAEFVETPIIAWELRYIIPTMKPNEPFYQKEPIAIDSFNDDVYALFNTETQEWYSCESWGHGKDDLYEQLKKEWGPHSD